MKILGKFTCILFLLLIIGCVEDYGYQESVKTITGNTQNDTKENEDISGQAHNSALVYIQESLIFEPEEVLINPGQSVTWQVNDAVEVPIRIEESSGLFVSDIMKGSDLFTYTFSEKGKYTIDLVNRGHKMSVLVE